MGKKKKSTKKPKKNVKMIGMEDVAEIIQ